MTPQQAKEMLPIITAFASGEPIQFRHPDNHENKWIPSQELSFMHPASCYRIAQRAININGLEVPEPLRVLPARGTLVFWPSLSHATLHSYARRDDQQWTRDFLDKGILHLTAEAAEKHAKALLSFAQTAPTQ